MHDVIIVGGGPSGLTAALYCARANLNILLIERMFLGGQMATTDILENYPGFEEPISGFELAMRMENQAKRFGVEIVNEDVIKMNLDEKVKLIETTDKVYRSKVVILCMGAVPRKMGLPKEKEFRGAGISYCATCDGSFYKEKNVVVVGGGDTAAVDAIYLARLCKKVYLIHRRDKLRATKAIQKEIFSNDKIEIVWDSTVEEIIGEFGVDGIIVKNVKTNKTRQIETGGIFVAIGVIPNTKRVKDKLPLSKEGYIVTDEKMQTGIPGVLAAGDIRDKVLRQIITAASDGAIAAYVAERYIGENEW